MQQIKIVRVKRRGDYLVFDDNLKSSLTFFKMMHVLPLLLTPAILCLRHKAYNSPLIIGLWAGLLYFRPWLSVSALVNRLEIKPDACQRHKHKGGRQPCWAAGTASTVRGNPATIRHLQKGGVGEWGKRCPQHVSNCGPSVCLSL